MLERWPLCSWCSDVGRVKPARVVDHIVRVRDGGEFWDLNNLQTMCDACHNAKSGREGNVRQGGMGVQNPKTDRHKDRRGKRSSFRRNFEGGVR